MTSPASTASATIVATETTCALTGTGDTVFAKNVSDEAELWQITAPRVRRGPAHARADRLGSRLSRHRPGHRARRADHAGDRLRGRGDRHRRPDDVERAAERVAYAPHAPDFDVEGSIISIHRGVSETGRLNVVALDTGEQDGLERGHVLALYRNRGVAEYRGEEGRESFRLPEKRYGVAFVFRVFERVAYALADGSTARSPSATRSASPDPAPASRSRRIVTAPADDLADWPRLASVPGVGTQGQRALLAAFGLPGHIFAAGRGALAAVVGGAAADAGAAARHGRTSSPRSLGRARPGNHIPTLADAAYPRQLFDTADPPVLLYVKGEPALLSRPGIALVGARSVTAAGEANAEAFARALAEQGLVVVSGLAVGIDAAAHRGAIAAGGAGAGTVAVIGTGIDRIYPARNAALARAIAAAGAVVSEFPLGTPPLQHNFRAVTASSPAWRRACWWSRRRSAAAR